MTFPPSLAIRALLVLLVLVAAVFDLREHRIPNWLTVSGLLLAVALNGFLDETAGLWFSIKGAGLAFAIYFVLYLLRAMGAGDVKLMAAVGAAAGPANWLGIFFLTVVIGGAAAVLLAVFKKRVRKTYQNMWLMLLSLRHGRAPYQDNPELDVHSDKALRLPHGAMIACGTVGFLVAAFIWAPR